MKNYKKYKILAVIPARGGSKGIPYKNIQLLGKKPLMVYTIEQARKSKFLTRVIVSSDDSKIIRIAKKYGAEASFKRPKKLAKDSTPSLPVLQHAVRRAEALNGVTYDYIVLLEVTTPFKTTEDIDGAILKLIRTKADSVVSVYEVSEMHPIKMKKIRNNRLFSFIKGKEILRRQDLPPVYKRNGGIYAMRRDVLMKKNSLFGRVCRPCIMPVERSFDINTPLDLFLARALLPYLKKQKYVPGSF